jgi:TRAP-type C4-dicarboxylate transport system permease small subunit
MEQFLRKTDSALMRFYAAAGVLAAVLLAVLAVLILIAIISRFVGAYVPGLNAYAGYVMGGSTFLAMAYTFREGGHIRVNILMNSLSGTARWLVQLWCFLAGSVISIFFAFYIVKMTLVSYRFEDLSEGADATPLWIPQALLATGAVVLAISVVHHLARFLLGQSSEADAESGEV